MSPPTRRLVLPSLALALIVSISSTASADTIIAEDTVVVPFRQYVSQAFTIENGLPSSTVLSLHHASDGYLWVGTAEGIARFDGLHFATFGRRDIAGLTNQIINTIAEDARGNIWFGTRGGGLVRFDGKSFRVITKKDSLANDYVFSLFAAPDGRLWVGTRSGLTSILGDEIVSYHFPERGRWNVISAIGQGPDGSLYLGTQGGIQRLDDYVSGSENGTITVEDGLPAPGVWALANTLDGRLMAGTDRGAAWIEKDGTVTVETQDGAPGRIVRALIEKRPGVFWIASENLHRLAHGRMEALHEGKAARMSGFFTVASDQDGNIWAGSNNGLLRLRAARVSSLGMEDGLPTNHFSGIAPSRDGGIWLSTFGEGLIHYDPKTGKHRVINEELPHNSFFSVFEDREGAVWLPASGSGGLVRMKGGSFSQYTPSEGLNALTTFSIIQDRRGRYWIATYGSGLAVLEDGRFTMKAGEAGLSSTNVRMLLETRDGTIWIGTYAGGLSRYRDGQIETYDVGEGLPDNSIYALHESSDGTLWIGTLGGGLARFRNGEFSSFGSADGLISDGVTGIIEDDFGYLWLGTGRGIVRVNRSRLDAYMDGSSAKVDFLVLNESDGLPFLSALGGSNSKVFKAEDGKLWFVMEEGISIVDPALVGHNPNPPIVRIESARIEGAQVSWTDALRMQPGQRNFQIRYTGISMLHADRVRFEYRLEGYDKNWIDAGGRRTAFYTNLPPGNYTFRVRAANADGIWDEKGATLAVISTPFFYQTFWFLAVCLLFIVGAALAGHLTRIYRLRRREKELTMRVSARTQELQREKETSEKMAARLQDLDEAKSRFFANVSHEFRTPLTLILGPIERAIAGEFGPVPAAMHSHLHSMERNAGRLLRLINQLLELSRIESGTLVVKNEMVNLTVLVPHVVCAYQSHARDRRIALHVEAAETLFVQGSAEKLETVMHNLVSNALKFTPEDGSVFVRITRESLDDADKVCVYVRDTGVGIPPGELERVFERYYQVHNGLDNVPAGTGIGLALCRQLIHAHGGTIHARAAEGGGAELVVALPVMSPDEGAYPVSGNGAANQPVHLEMPVVDQPISAQEPDNDGPPRPLILVIDDETDMRNYIVSVLSPAYRTVVATNGEDALRRLQTLTPDLIVSDLMMPEMDGLTLFRKISGETAAAHVPFILLTARTSTTLKLEGLEAGITDYVGKPFAAPELRARVRNAIELYRHRSLLEQLNADLRSAVSNLEEANRQKSRMLGMAAHDLKNPLTGIRGFAELLREELALDARNDEMLAHIEGSADQALESIKELLDSAALETGRIRLRRTRIDICGLVPQVVDRYRELARAKDQQIHLEVPDCRCTLHGDSIRLTEVVENLVSNAVKYSYRGGSIRVSVERMVGEIRIAVKDSGPGISEDDRKQLFKPFQRLSARPTGNESSTGLGLSLAHQFVTLHGGRLEAESDTTGSTFIATLPAPAAIKKAIPAHIG